MKIYKPKNSKGKTRSKWYITFYHLDKRRRVAVSTNRTATEKIATAVDGMLACNGSLTPELQVFVSTMNPKLRDKLLDFGVITKDQVPTVSIHAGKTLAGHVKDFSDSLRAKGNKASNITYVERALSRIFARCGFDSITDIDANTFYTTLADMRGDNFGERSFNRCLKSAKQMTRWLVRENRADSDPLKYLSCITQTEKRRQRRALTLDEQRRLIEATAKGKRRHHNIDGPARALLYRTALQTGLRANELRNLTVGGFDFDARTATLESAFTKNKRLAVQPLTKSLAADLQAFVSSKLPTTKVFTVSRNTAEMIQIDLKAAEIEYKTDEGQADFHSLRHSFITNLARAGVHPSDAMVLARHSTITLTMNFYTHTHRESLQGIIDAQPDLTKKVPKKCPKSARQWTATDRHGQGNNDNKPKTAIAG